MCLALNPSSKEQKRAFEDIICYKVVEKINNRFVSPFMNTEVIIGATYTSRIVIESTKSIYGEDVDVVLEALHSCLDFSSALGIYSYLSDDFNLCIIKCKIPVGSIYHISDNHIASNRLQYLEIIK